jgi:methylthioribose-1-phosphate isomerase/methylthioribulose-1-phosphate dehydratase
MVLPASRTSGQELARFAGALYRRGWMEGTAGNVSVRDGDHVLITASGRGKGELTSDDTVLMDLVTGEPAVPGQPKSSAETCIHLALYRAFDDVGAVVHAHPPYATALSCLVEVGDGPAVVGFERFEIIKGLGLPDPARVDVPVFANWPHVPDIAEDIARHYRGAVGDPGVPPVLLIGHHGATAWGADLAQARNRMECVEALCQLHLMTRGIVR